MNSHIPTKSEELCRNLETFPHFYFFLNSFKRIQAIASLCIKRYKKKKSLAETGVLQKKKFGIDPLNQLTLSFFAQ